MAAEFLCVLVVVLLVLIFLILTLYWGAHKRATETRRELYRQYLRQCLSVKRMVVDLRHAKTDKQRNLVTDGIAVYAAQLESKATEAGKEFTTKSV